MSQQGKVYFVSGPGRIKIGFTTKPEDRLRSLQTADMERLSMIAIVDGSRALERHLHILCEDHQKYKEWFEDNAFVRDVIDRVISGEIKVEEKPRADIAISKDNSDYFQFKILPILDARLQADRLYRIFLEEILEVINDRIARGQPIERFLEIHRRMIPKPLEAVTVETSEVEASQ